MPAFLLLAWESAKGKGDMRVGEKDMCRDRWEEDFVIFTTKRLLHSGIEREFWSSVDLIDFV